MAKTKSIPPEWAVSHFDQGNAYQKHTHTHTHIGLIWQRVLSSSTSTALCVTNFAKLLAASRQQQQFHSNLPRKMLSAIDTRCTCSIRTYHHQPTTWGTHLQRQHCGNGVWSECVSETIRSVRTRKKTWLSETCARWLISDGFTLHTLG